MCRRRVVGTKIRAVYRTRTSNASERTRTSPAAKFSVMVVSGRCFCSCVDPRCLSALRIHTHAPRDPAAPRRQYCAQCALFTRRVLQNIAPNLPARAARVHARRHSPRGPSSVERECIRVAAIFVGHDHCLTALNILRRHQEQGLPTVTFSRALSLHFHRLLAFLFFFGKKRRVREVRFQDSRSLIHERIRPLPRPA